MDTDRVLPHGGALVHLIVDDGRAAELREASRDMASITMTSRQVSDLEMLMNGAYSPLTGFMGRADYESVLDWMRLADGTF